MVRFPQKPGHGFFSGFQRRFNIRNKAGVNRYVILGQCFEKTFRTGLTDLRRKPSCQQADFTVSALTQVCRCLYRAAVVVSGHTQQSVQIQPVVHQNHWNVLLTEFFNGSCIGLASKYHAIHMLFDVDVSIRQPHILAGRYKQAVIPAGSFLHSSFQKRGVERIQNSRILLFMNDKRDVFRPLPHHRPRNCVRRIVQLLCGRVYLFTRFFADCLRGCIRSGDRRF